MTGSFISEADLKKSLRRQADKISTYSFAIKEKLFTAGQIQPVANMLGIAADPDMVAARLTSFENICHVLSHLHPSGLRDSEWKTLGLYSEIAVPLDALMLELAELIPYETDRQNSRNWIEEHQYRPDYSPEMPAILEFLHLQAADESAA